MTERHPSNEGRTQPPRLTAIGSPHKNQALSFLLQRIEVVLGEERQLLAGNDPEDIDRITTRKDHLALEAARLVVGEGRLDVDPMVRMKLLAVKEMLSNNASLLERHIEAVGEIAALVAGVLNQATSDGTYTSELGQRGRKP